jgi:hypothetical protein
VPVVCSALQEKTLHGIFTALAAADADRLFQRLDKYLAVTAKAGMGRPFNHRNGFLSQFVRAGNFQPDVWLKIQGNLRLFIWVCLLLSRPKP